MHTALLYIFMRETEHVTLPTLSFPDIYLFLIFSITSSGKPEARVIGTRLVAILLYYNIILYCAPICCGQ